MDIDPTVFASFMGGLNEYRVSQRVPCFVAMFLIGCQVHYRLVCQVELNKCISINCSVVTITFFVSRVPRYVLLFRVLTTNRFMIIS